METRKDRSISGLLVFMFAFVVLANVMLTGCDNRTSTSYTIDSLYGRWVFEDTVEGWNVQLELRQDKKLLYLYFYNPRVEDGQKYYRNWEDKVFHTFSLSGDSIIMTDVDGNVTVSRILEYNDSTLVLENLLDVKSRIRLHLDYKGEIIDDWYMPEDSLDYVIKNYMPFVVEGISFDLTKENITQALSLMQECVDRDSVSFECGLERMYPLNWYIRQYAGYVSEQGHKMVYVSLTLNSKAVLTMLGEDEPLDLNRYMMNVMDGGENYADATIDLTTKKVLFFKTHGVA